MKAIQQSVTFKAPPKRLFDIFTDSKKHSAATGSKALVSKKTGGKWSAFDGMIHGRNLLGIPDRVVVQEWSSSHWKKTDADSILILTFSKASGGGRVDLVHVNVPDHDHAGVSEGWPNYYWKPWKRYLKGKAK
jgi:activator of HSP90 ATPase